MGGSKVVDQKNSTGQILDLGIGLAKKPPTPTIWFFLGHTYITSHVLPMLCEGSETRKGKTTSYYIATQPSCFLLCPKVGSLVFCDMFIDNKNCLKTNMWFFLFLKLVYEVCCSSRVWGHFYVNIHFHSQVTGFRELHDTHKIKAEICWQVITYFITWWAFSLFYLNILSFLLGSLLSWDVQPFF